MAIAFFAGIYFLGNINPAIIIGRAQGIDVRAQGSGNPGTTQAMRSLGKKAGVVVFLIDALKGWLGFSIPLYLLGVYGFAFMCGLCVVVGHMYPAVFGFRGGKGVATAFGVLLAASWPHALILLAIVIVITAIWRYVSLSVLIAVAAALVMTFVFFIFDPIWLTIILALIVWKHRANIGRLVRGEENKLSFGGKK